MKKSLKIIFLLGLLKALPVVAGSPHGVPRGNEARPLFAHWTFIAGYRDVLEISDLPDFTTHTDIPGPYEVHNLGGVPTYSVPVPVGRAKAFFRVRREWGFPWLPGFPNPNT
jgi:hypothetical protein